MRITFDPAKRAQTLIERGLDCPRARELFAGPTLSFDDRRGDYGEARTVSVGMLDDGGLDATRNRVARHFNEVLQ